MSLRVLQYPDGQTEQKEIHARFKYVTVIQIGKNWQILHAHINRANALKAFKAITRFILNADLTEEESPCKIIKLF